MYFLVYSYITIYLYIETKHLHIVDLYRLNIYMDFFFIEIITLMRIDYYLADEHRK